MLFIADPLIFPYKQLSSALNYFSPLPSQTEQCKITTDHPGLRANLDKGHRIPLGRIAGDRLPPGLSRKAFRT